ncbi:MAG: permease prefix domain 1-containing protein [Acidimicrobiia bacterium]|nr:permease prefix domain 1-containing protein [Acidimicrobiia bacterium]
MAEVLIDVYVEEVRRHLPMTGAYRKRILEELRDHLEDAASELESDGMTAHAATQEAIASLGSATQVARRFRAAATGRTRLLAALAGCGALIGFAAVRLANVLHADGERLGADVRYSLVWAIGLASGAAVVGLLIAVGLRLGPRRLEVKGAIATAVLALAGIGVFHLANDGTLERGPDSDVWRLGALGAGVAASTLLLVAIRRTRSGLDRAGWVTFAAMLLLAAHYTVLDQDGPAALAAVVALAVAWLWALAALVRERPLA